MTNLDVTPPLFMYTEYLLPVLLKTHWSLKVYNCESSPWPNSTFAPVIMVQEFTLFLEVLSGESELRY